MKSKPKNSNQKSFVYEGLEDTLNPKHPLYILTSKMPWGMFEDEFEKLYSRLGRPAKRIRLMVSLLILKQMNDLSDENLVKRWVENPYWQYFSGETQFQWRFPCDPSELTYFRKRIGERGAEKIFEASIKLHGKKAEESEVIADTTAQEKNISYPTDLKLQMQVINFCRRVNDKEGLPMRQSYKYVLPNLLWTTRYVANAKRQKEGRKAVKKIKTIAGRLLRELERNLSAAQHEKYREQIEIANKILTQKKSDKNKIYSFHEPKVACIAKGKAGKKYEFGSKASILLSKNAGIIVGAKNFSGNPYDGHTLEPTLKQYKEIMGKTPQKVLVDEGYRGRKFIGETEILRVHKKRPEQYSTWRWRQRFRRRSSVEAAISHLKLDFRMARNYLKGGEGDVINILLSSAAFNIKKLLRELAFCLQNLIAPTRFLIAFDIIFQRFAA